MYNVELYTPERKKEWNIFIENAKNSTFLFDRNYMDYHADRFQDSSLMIYRKINYMHYSLLIRKVMYYIHTKDLPTVDLLCQRNPQH